jgi:hypothetical protein
LPLVVSNTGLSDRSHADTKRLVHIKILFFKYRLYVRSGVLYLFICIIILVNWILFPPFPKRRPRQPNTSMRTAHAISCFLFFFFLVLLEERRGKGRDPRFSIISRSSTTMACVCMYVCLYAMVCPESISILFLRPPPPLSNSRRMYYDSRFAASSMLHIHITLLLLHSESKRERSQKQNPNSKGRRVDFRRRFLPSPPPGPHMHFSTSFPSLPLPKEGKEEKKKILNFYSDHIVAVFGIDVDIYYCMYIQMF